MAGDRGPRRDLGVRDYPVEQQFERLGEAIRLSDGTIVVLELGDMELQAFNTSGGLPSEGPGWQNPARIRQVEVQGKWALKRG